MHRRGDIRRWDNHREPLIYAWVSLDVKETALLPEAIEPPLYLRRLIALGKLHRTPPRAVRTHISKSTEESQFMGQVSAFAGHPKCSFFDKCQHFLVTR